MLAVMRLPLWHSLRLPSTLRERPTSTMQSAANPRRTCRLAVLSALAVAACLPLRAQTPQGSSTLPATPPTSIPAAPTPPQPAAPQHADVTFADGQLTVRANNSSLHQILSSLAHLTGMTITGGVTDQRVFGTYGPGDASTILATLLDGTGVNILIREGYANRPTELILTPRTGAPGPSITAQDAEIGNNQPGNNQPAPDSGQTTSSASGVHTLAPGASMQVTLPQPANQAPAQPAPAAATSTEPAAGPLTPDQVYQKILQMQKDKAAAAANPTH